MMTQPYYEMDAARRCVGAPAINEVMYKSLCERPLRRPATVRSATAKLDLLALGNIRVVAANRVAASAAPADPHPNTPDFGQHSHGQVARRHKLRPGCLRRAAAARANRRVHRRLFHGPAAAGGLTVRKHTLARPAARTLANRLATVARERRRAATQRAFQLLDLPAQ